jgi:hypothetical protein
MAARIRRAGVAAALALLLMATALAGVAQAKIVIGTPGNDYLLGTTKTDLIRGRGGDDYIRALAGDDLLLGGAGDDVVRGGGGNDKIYPGEGPDIVLAGAGNDKIYARDAGSLDSIDCGGGFDKVETIHRDDRTLENCERTLGPRRGMSSRGVVDMRAVAHGPRPTVSRVARKHIYGAVGRSVR